MPASPLGSNLAAEKPVTHPQGVVVLAGGGEQRLKTGAQVFLELEPPWIALTNDGVLSRWSRQQQRNLLQIEWHSLRLQELGVPEAAIVLLPFTESGTRFDAMHARQWATEQGLQRLLLVTSDYHTRRTLWTFERIFAGTGMEIGVLSAHEDKPEGFDLAGYWRRGFTLLKETAKFVGYRAVIGRDR